MARFVFQLEGVLRHRKHVEQQKQRDVAIVQKQMQDLQTELRTLNDTVQAATADMKQNHLVGRLDLAFLAAHRRFTIAMQRKAMNLMQKMALVQRQVQEAQKALAEAAKQRKIMEKLRERQFARWRADLERREMLELDEIGMQLSYQLTREQGVGPDAREDASDGETATDPAATAVLSGANEPGAGSNAS